MHQKVPQHQKNGFTVKASQGHVTGSEHKYTLSEPTAVAYSPDWFHQNTSPSMEYDRLCHCIGLRMSLFKALRNLENQYCHEHQSAFWPLQMDKYHDYTHFEPTIVALSANWLHLDTFPSAEDTLPLTIRILNLVWSSNMGYRGGSATAVQTWRPCPLREPSPSHPIVLM